jgi:hypothetical protein
MEPNRQNIADLELKHGRDINLLLDNQRPPIANALAQLSKAIAGTQYPPSDRIYFFENYVLRNYLSTFDSGFDTVREAALTFLRPIIDTFKSGNLRLTPESQTAILGRLLGRVSTVPFKEPSEEVRLAIIKILIDLLPYFEDGFFRLAGEAIQATACLLQDKFPESKKQTCLLLEKMTLSYPEQIASGSKKLITQLTVNAFHAHSKIRKVSIETLTRVLGLPKVGENVRPAVEAISPLATDKSAEIREAVYRCYKGCLVSLGFETLKENEIFLMCELFAGVDDESPTVAGLCREALETFAERRKELFDKFET